jgi:hypothetical protein
MQTKEQVFIVYSVKGTLKEHIHEACDAISSFRLKSSIVSSVLVTPFIFELPVTSGPGKTLNTELIKELQNSIGAIIFIDDLRPNISYELGFFHGQGKPVLLLTNQEISSTWASISDLAGVVLADISQRPIKLYIDKYLDQLYIKLAANPILHITEMPSKEKNGLKKIIQTARIEVQTKKAEYGESIIIDTWGGIIFDVSYNLIQDAKFKIVLRSFEKAVFSIYFLIKFINSKGETKSIQIGITSSRTNTGFESNERNLATQSISKKWSMLSYTFKSLLEAGQILEKIRVIQLERIRVRSNYNENAMEKVAAYEIGYFEIIGIDS